MNDHFSNTLKDQIFRLLSLGSYGLQFIWHLKRLLPKQGNFLFIASMPKSGSTFMANTLAELTGYRKINLTYAFERNDQNLYLPKLIDSCHLNTVTSQHIRATDSNLMLMKKFGLQPVILIRNIFDVVVSIRDHFYKESYKFPTVYCDENFFKLNEKRQYDFIIELALPWYFNFYVSWYEATKSGVIETLWISFEKAVTNWEEAFKKIIHFYHLNKTKMEICKALGKNLKKKKNENRINKGIVGRGEKILTETQQQRIFQYAQFYPEIDFTSIGIKRQGTHLYATCSSREKFSAIR